MCEKSLEEINHSFTKQRPPGSEAPAKQKNTPVLKKRYKWVTVVSNVIFYLVIAGMLIAAIAFAQSSNYQKSIFGYRFYNVLSDSMTDAYPRGTMLAVKQTDPGEIKIGDDITFVSDTGAVVTHRVVEVIGDYNNSGSYGYRTKGVNNWYPDDVIVYAANVLGRVDKSIPKLGLVFYWLGSHIFGILVLLILSLVFSFAIRIFWGEEKKDRERRRCERQRKLAYERIKSWESR